MENSDLPRRFRDWIIRYVALMFNVWFETKEIELDIENVSTEEMKKEGGNPKNGSVDY